MTTLTGIPLFSDLGCGSSNVHLIMLHTGLSNRFLNVALGKEEEEREVTICNRLASYEVFCDFIPELFLPLMPHPPDSMYPYQDDSESNNNS